MHKVENLNSSNPRPVLTGATLASITIMNRFVFLILFVCFIKVSYSQQIGVEGLIGYSIFPVPSEGQKINGFQISLLADFYPPKTFWSVTGGVVFQNENEWNFLKIPFKLTFSIGNKVAFLFGGGLAANYIMLQSAYYDKYGVLSRSDFTVNGIVLAGLSVNIFKNWIIYFH